VTDPTRAPASPRSPAVHELVGAEFDPGRWLADAMSVPGWQDQIVARPDGGSGAGNAHAAWRLAVAEQAARAYASNDKLAALTVAGSVGAGLADRFSDLELDCYWVDPPDDLDRSGPVHVLGGDLEALWDYDHDEEEWSDDYRLGDLEVTVRTITAPSPGRPAACQAQTCCSIRPDCARCPVSTNPCR